jgi:ATP-dependent DNA helicase PIF1
MQDRLILQTKYAQLRIIVVDEISMVGNRQFSFINLRLQEIMGNQQIFDGIHFLAVGDLFQLQPVCDRWIFSGENHIDPGIWGNYFRIYELTEIMRQKGDQRFVELLNRMREGLQTVLQFKQEISNPLTTYPAFLHTTSQNNSTTIG